MRIGFITQWYAPESGAAAHPTVIAEALLARGHEVRVVTGFPSYPAGRVYEGYDMGRRAQQEELHGVTVLRVPLIPSHDASAVRRTLTYLSFAVSAVRSLRWLRTSDVVLVYASPVTATLPARLLRRWKRIPYVMYVQDLWPDSVLESGFIKGARRNGIAEKVLHRLCDGMYRHSARVLVIAPGMERRILGRGIDPERIDVVYNWVDERAFRPAAPDFDIVGRVPEGTRFTLMYAGAMGELQQLETVVRAVASLEGDHRCHLFLVGDGVTKSLLRALVRDLGVSASVTFIDSRPLSAMAGTLAGADAQYVSLKDVPLLHLTVPSKVQACMAAGRALICSAPGDASDLVGEAGCGITVAPGDHLALAEAIGTMAGLSSVEREAMGDSGRAFYLRRLGEHHGTDLMEQHLRAAAEEQR